MNVKLHNHIWPSVRYDYSKHNKLNFKFKDSDKITKNYSQAYQDMFVLSMLDGKKNGTYLEIGSAEPFYNNNTALLEKEFGWKGISIDISQKLVDEFNEERDNLVLCKDATKVDYNDILKEIKGNDIDYLQIDCDPPEVSYNILLKIPFNKYRFAVITFEHDCYNGGKIISDKSRDFLKSFGYILIADDISPDDNSPFEDWWVHPDLIDKEIINKMLMVNNTTKNVEKYMMKKESNKNENKLYTNDLREESSFGIIETNKFKISTEQKKRVWIIDNFYEDPNAIREFALSQYYFDDEGYVGMRTRKQFMIEGVKERLEEIMGAKITKWEGYAMNGRFQSNIAGAPTSYHCDDQEWAAMIYLTPNAPFSSGTKIIANKTNKIYHNKQTDNVLDFFPNQKTFTDGTLFEDVDVIGNVYNRLAIFDAGSIHCAGDYFGWDIASGRLWQMFFFDADINK